MATYYDKRGVLTVNIVLNSVAVLVGMGLFLSMVGLYGVVAFSVGRRKREIGLRMAIGADRAQVIQMILKQGLLLAGGGVLLGMLLSWAARPMIGSILTGGSSVWDIPLAALIGIAMLIITLFASFVPARRASLIDPMTALRDE